MKKIILVLLIFSTVPVFSSKIINAYKALSLYDYFKAKKFFYYSLAKNPTEASYGLATIFYRNDNPFSNIDSAAKYIAKSNRFFKDSVTLSGYKISRGTINHLMGKISSTGLEYYARYKTTSSLNHFLTSFYFGDDSLLNTARVIRDELYLHNYTSSASSDSMHFFMLDHPESIFYAKAKTLFYNFQFSENTTEKSVGEYKRFIVQYPQNPNTVLAEYKLFELTKELHLADSLYAFIKKYSRLTTDEAWKMLYSISVKYYAKKELKQFLSNYPEYPYSETIEKEIILSQKIVYPLKDGMDKYGFIDTLGNWIIKPVFDDAGYFKEGFAWVCKNDSCFYINKEGVKTSAFYFEETEDYENGLAIVKNQNHFFLINRSGQLITKGFEDINKASDNLFVCKKDNFYGAINTKGETVIPFTYQKLGNFKNGYAYYLSNKYGLVNIYNQALKADWDWISEIEANNLVVVKKGLKFGLMQLNDSLLLFPEFDYISYCENGIYIIVKNNLYGFYNATEKCYVTAIAYDYDKSLSNAYYTNGKQFKLIKDGDVALVDANGRTSIGFGTYTNVFFAKNEVIRIMKGKKFGYVDRKLNPITPVEFEKAGDYENNLAIVSKGATTQLINKTGKVIFSIKEGSIEKLKSDFYVTGQKDLFGLLKSTGEVLLPNEFTTLHYLGNNLWSVTKNNQFYVFKPNTKTLIKI